MFKLVFSYLTDPRLRFLATFGGDLWAAMDAILKGRDESKQVDKLVKTIYPKLPEDVQEAASQDEIKQAVIKGKDSVMAVIKLFEKNIVGPQLP